MTLMSVFWEDGRVELENFSLQATVPSEGQASPYNHFIKPSPDQMLRATVGLALKRARLANVYSALRGKDAATGVDNPDKREGQFTLMREHVAHVAMLGAAKRDFPPFVMRVPIEVRSSQCRTEGLRIDACCPR
ncbi:MAG: hypothetical protein H2049_09805 [Porphyrobacter sp.]|nr:hypothetical protein [Porphyrobacter sp.]